MTEPSESVLLCEGYHDRAFLTGWLEHLGCSNPSTQGARTGIVTDPWDQTVRGGQYAFHSSSGRFIRISPVGGQSNLRLAARLRLDKRQLELLTRLVICVDPDTDASDPADTRNGMRVEDVERFVQDFDPAASCNRAAGEFTLDGGGTQVSLIRWEVDADPLPGVPNQQTLERLVCTALCHAYPERGSCVQRWLESRPQPPVENVKAFAWSHMAGWYAGHGCDHFFRHLWQDGRVVEKMEPLLRLSAAWQVMEEIAR